MNDEKELAVKKDLQEKNIWWGEQRKILIHKGEVRLIAARHDAC